MTKLEGKIAVITGATSGMALATAKLFVTEGAYVYITGRRKDKLDEAVESISVLASGGFAGVTGVQSDSANLDDLDRLFGTVKTAHGRVDVLYVAAGMGNVSEPLPAVTTDSFDEVFNLNVRGTLFTVQKALPLMTDGGSIILNGSAGAVKGVPGTSVYSASKAALRSFARTWTSELKDQGIRVNLISPGPIDTASFDGVPDEFRTMIAAQLPAGRLGKSEEIAAAALFLGSTDSSFVYGTELAVDGGLAQI